MSDAGAVITLNRFERVHAEEDLEQLEHDEEMSAEPPRWPTTFLPNDTRSIICENDSPDIGFLTTARESASRLRAWRAPIAALGRGTSYWA